MSQVLVKRLVVIRISASQLPILPVFGHPVGEQGLALVYGALGIVELLLVPGLRSRADALDWEYLFHQVLQHGEGVRGMKRERDRRVINLRERTLRGHDRRRHGIEKNEK